MEASGVRIHLTAYLDTANHLNDVFSGLPVALCTSEALKPLLGEAGVRWVKEGKYLSLPPPEETAALHFRLIPFTGMGGDGVLPAFQPEGLWLEEKESESKRFCAVIAITSRPFRQGYDMLLHPDIHIEERSCREDTAAAGEHLI